MMLNIRRLYSGITFKTEITLLARCNQANCIPNTELSSTHWVRRGLSMFYTNCTRWCDHNSYNPNRLHYYVPARYWVRYTLSMTKYCNYAREWWHDIVNDIGYRQGNDGWRLCGIIRNQDVELSMQARWMSLLREPGRHHPPLLAEVQTVAS